MGFFSSAEISSSGMSVQRTVMDIIAENLANINTMQVDGGDPYKRKIPIIGQYGISQFASIFKDKMSVKPYVKNIEEDLSDPKKVYEPGNPLADDDGYVYKPNINTNTEMINMIFATRVYEANIVAFNGSISMAERALQIGT